MRVAPLTPSSNLLRGLELSMTEEGSRDWIPAHLDAPLLALLSLSLLLVGLGWGSLRDWDEALYAELARELLEGGSWLQLTWNGVPWFDKPPLVVWCMALAYEIGGVGEWTARIFPALCGSAGVLVTYLFTREILGRRVGLITALILLATPHYAVQSKLAMLDVPLTLFVSLSLFCYWKSLARPRWLLAAGAAFGLAFMTKGAAAAVAPLAALVHAAIHGELRLLRSPWLWGGALIALAIALPWHLHQYLEHGSTFLEHFVGYHVVERASTALEGHEGSPLFYLDVLARRQRPWVLVTLPALAWCAVVAWRERDRRLSFFLCWVGAVAFIVTTVSTRISWYLLPIYPALSACTAWLLVRIVPPRHFRWLALSCLTVLALHAVLNHNLFDGDYSPEVKALGPHIQSALEPEEPLVLHEVWPMAALFYGQRRIEALSRQGLPQLARLVAEREAVVVLTRSASIAAGEGLLGVRSHTIASEKDLHLVRFTASETTRP